MHFINKKKVGVDISDRSIEIAEISKNGDKVNISALGRVVLNEGIVKWGEIKDEAKLSEAFTRALKAASPRAIETTEIILGLPESQVFTYHFSIKTDEKSSLASLIKAEAIKNIPIPEKDLIFSHKILDKQKVEVRNDKKTKTATLFNISLVATSKKQLLMWQNFFKKLGISIELFDIESLALFRSIYKAPSQEHICLVDIGALTSNISIFSQDGLCFSHFIKKAGEIFTENIAEIRKNAQGEKLGTELAEKLKIEYGLSKEGEYGAELEMVLNSGVNCILQEIKKILAYHQTKFQKNIAEIVLLGGSAKMKGLLEYFQKNLVVSHLIPQISEQKSPISKDSDEKKESSAALNKNANIVLGKSAYLPDGNLLEYIEAIGVALRGCDSCYEKDHFFASIDLKKLEKEKQKMAKENEKEKAATDGEQNLSWFKAHKQETQLLAILLIGLILIAGAFWYRNYSASKNYQSQETALGAYEYEENAEYDIPVRTDLNAYDGSFARARIFTKTFAKALELSAAEKQGKTEALADLRKGEELWPTPVLGAETEEKIIFPLDYAWLIFRKADLDKLIMKKIKADVLEKEFMFSESEYLELKKGEEDNSYLLRVKVKFFTTEKIKGSGSENSPQGAVIEKIDTDAGLSSSTEETDSINSASAGEDGSLDDLKKLLFKARSEIGEGDILIKETETGWLNVRSGPGTNFDAVSRVREGESYDLLEEQDDWLKIDLGENASGWIFGKYAEKK